jgi:hypothetical protein
MGLLPNVVASKIFWIFRQFGLKIFEGIWIILAKKFSIQIGKKTKISAVTMFDNSPVIKFKL